LFIGIKRNLDTLITDTFFDRFKIFIPLIEAFQSNWFFFNVS